MMPNGTMPAGVFDRVGLMDGSRAKPAKDRQVRPPLARGALPDSVFTAFGAAAAAIHAADFHDQLLQAAGSLVAHDLLSIMRYSRFSAPDFLASHDYTLEFVALYNTEFYRYDPYYRYWKEGGGAGIVPLSRVSNALGLRHRYVTAVLAEAHITDEVSIFLPPVGGCCLALFIDRCSGKFTKAEIARLEAAYPLIAGLQEAHVGSLKSGGWSKGDDVSNTLPPARPIRILDRRQREVFQNQAWQNLAHREGSLLTSAIAALPKTGAGQATLHGDQVLHRAALPAEFGLAPGGWIDMVEPLGRTPRHPEQFALPTSLAAALTPREADIVRLILQGHPSTSIAEKLGVSRGTIKNHRLRLYEKLDITSEREIFLRYITASIGEE
jgi:DNA-binding CsgD family transcriptional regulator